MKLSIGSYYLMKPKVDFCFKELMKDPYVRRGFIAALINRKPEDIEETELISTEMNRKYEDDKLGILDVRVKLKDGTQIDMEMQVAPYPLWPERSVFYLSKMLVSQIHKGDSYKVLPKCIHVGILDFTLYPEVEEFYSCFHLREDTRHSLYTDKMEVHILELPKLAKHEYPETALLDWARFFNAEEKEEFEEVAEKNSYINRAYKELQSISADEKKRLEYEAREKAIMDNISFIRDNRELAWEEGIKKGKKEGREEGALLKLISQVRKKADKGQQEETIIEDLMEEPVLIRKIYSIIQKNSQFTDEEIYSKL